MDASNHPSDDVVGQDGNSTNSPAVVLCTSSSPKQHPPMLTEFTENMNAKRSSPPTASSNGRFGGNWTEESLQIANRPRLSNNVPQGEYVFPGGRVFSVVEHFLEAVVDEWLDKLNRVPQHWSRFITGSTLSSTANAYAEAKARKEEEATARELEEANAREQEEMEARVAEEAKVREEEEVRAQAEADAEHQKRMEEVEEQIRDLNAKEKAEKAASDERDAQIEGVDKMIEDLLAQSLTGTALLRQNNLLKR